MVSPFWGAGATVSDGHQDSPVRPDDTRHYVGMAATYDDVNVNVSGGMVHDVMCEPGTSLACNRMPVSDKTMTVTDRWP